MKVKKKNPDKTLAPGQELPEHWLDQPAESKIEIGCEQGTNPCFTYLRLHNIYCANQNYAYKEINIINDSGEGVLSYIFGINFSSVFYDNIAYFF